MLKVNLLHYEMVSRNQLLVS